MAILVSKDTRLVVQGMTGRAGTFYTDQIIDYGTTVVGGVRPGRGGTRHLMLPVFDTVPKAVAETDANASLVFVPAPNAADAMIEAIEAGIGLVVCVTERVPILDMVRVRHALNGSSTRLVGPNSQGLLAPGLAKLGVMSVDDATPGPVGIVSRSASLTSEIVAQATAAGLGQSTTVGIGGDPIHGVGFVDCLRLFMDDPETGAVVLIGEIGGREEEAAAAYLAEAKPEKPVVALVAGRHAPPERRMGHAGALELFGEGGARAKGEALRAAGAHVAPDAAGIVPLLQGALKGRA
ncbi:MAG: succinate--CoA ligase subunit alpha [Geminicoccaceae bacterium]|nr:succinate--CoA ligase subunit alpha [Geminicoccaceae bacterium]